MRRLLTLNRNLFLALLLVAACVTTAHAQSGGPYQITRPTIAGGSDTSAGGSYVIIGTMAQHDAVTGGGGPYLFDGGFWPSDLLQPHPPPCATDVSAQVQIRRSSDDERRQGRNRFEQVVQLINIGHSVIHGPISLVLDHLSEDVILLHPSGRTSCAAPVSPYVEVNVGRDDIFMPGERVTLVLRFKGRFDGEEANFIYRTRVLAGSIR